MKYLALVLLVLVACTAVKTGPAMQEKAQAKQVPPVPEPAKATMEETGEDEEPKPALDCKAIITDSDATGACKKLSGGDFVAAPDGTGCIYDKELGSLSILVGLPEDGGEQGVQNMLIVLSEKEKMSLPFTAYYGFAASRHHVMYAKGKYFVDIFSPFFEGQDQVCTKEELQAFAVKVAGKLP